MKAQVYLPSETALLFPAGGYLWPGMGAELQETPQRELFLRAGSALAALGEPEGALERLLAGEDQARRSRTATGWRWEGNYPLSMAAQVLVEAALGCELVRREGAPRVLVGESMGELAAYAVAGALEIEETITLTYCWARDLAWASDRLALRMAVVEGLVEEELGEVGGPLEAVIVVAESPGLHVVSLPTRWLDELATRVAARGGIVRVSNNHCVAHDPRLAIVDSVWDEHERLVASLRLRPPSMLLLSTIEPGRPLDTEDALRENRVATTRTRVRWWETLRLLPGLGVRRLLQLGGASSIYPLRRLRSEEPALRDVRVKVLSSLA